MSQDSWLNTARSIGFQGPSTLIAELQKADGTWQYAKINLDQYLGNSAGMGLLLSIYTTMRINHGLCLGKFQWNGNNFSATARYVRVEDRRPGAFEIWILGALQLPNGEWPDDPNAAGLNLTNAMRNNNGEFDWYVRSFHDQFMHTWLLTCAWLS